MSTTPANPSVPDGEAPVRIVPKRSAQIQFTSTMLLLEAFVVLFAALVMYGMRDVPAAWPLLAPPSGTAIWALGGVLAVVLLVLSRRCGKPGGYLAGSIVQVPVLALALWVPMMLIAGGIFVVLWIAALRSGGRIDRERAEYDAEHPETAPNPR